MYHWVINGLYAGKMSVAQYLTLQAFDVYNHAQQKDKILDELNKAREWHEARQAGKPVVGEAPKNSVADLTAKARHHNMWIEKTIRSSRIIDHMVKELKRAKGHPGVLPYHVVGAFIVFPDALM